MKLLLCIWRLATVYLKASLLLNVLICIRPLAFITEVLHIAATVRCFFSSYVVPCYLSLLGRCSQCAVLLRPCPSILSMAIGIKQLKSRKICKICLNTQRAFVNQATPTHFIDSRCQANKLKSCKTGLTSYLQVHFTWIAIT